MNEQHIIEAIKDATEIEAESVEAAVDQLIDYHFDVAMGLQNDCNTYKAEIERLKQVLRNIHTTAAKAGNEQATALAWIEGEAARVLRETLEPLAPDEQLPFDGGDTPYIELSPRVAHLDMCEECGNYPTMIGYRICEECARRDLMQYGGLEGEAS